jgi:type VI protein secretion system component VasF
MRAEDGPDPSATVLFAVNQADHSASQLDDRLPELAIPAATSPRRSTRPRPRSARAPLWTLLLLLAVALLALEWATYHRRWTV